MTRYVADTIEFPTSSYHAFALALDVDCDPQRRGDNALGHITAWVGSQLDVDIDTEAQELIDAGELLHLFEITTASFDDAPSAGVVVAHGIDTDGDSLDNFSGQEPFAIDDSRGRGRGERASTRRIWWTTREPFPMVNILIAKTNIFR